MLTVFLVNIFQASTVIGIMQVNKLIINFQASKKT